MRRIHLIPLLTALVLCGCDSNPTDMPARDEITLSASFSEMQVGNAWRLWYYVKGQGAAPVLWRSSDTAVATVEQVGDAGVVTARESGSTWISVELQADASVRDSVQILVKPTPTAGYPIGSLVIHSVTVHGTSEPINPNAVHGTVDIYADYEVASDVVGHATIEFRFRDQLLCTETVAEPHGQDMCTMDTTDLVDGQPRFPNGGGPLAVRLVPETGLSQSTGMQLTIVN